MLSLCPPVTPQIPPPHLIRLLAIVAAASNLKGGVGQGILHAAQYGDAMQLSVPAGFPLCSQCPCFCSGLIKNNQPVRGSLRRSRSYTSIAIGFGSKVLKRSGGLKIPKLWSCDGVPIHIF